MSHWSDGAQPPPHALGHCTEQLPPQPAEQAQALLQSTPPLHALVPQLTLQRPLPHSMPPLHALVAHVTEHTPEPQVILPLHALVPQLTVHASPAEQSMLSLH